MLDFANAAEIIREGVAAVGGQEVLWGAVIASVLVLAFVTTGIWWVRRILRAAGVRSRQEVEDAE